MSAVTNARWIGVSQGCRIGLQILSMLIMARLLTPADFGIVAMATVITNFASILVDLGTGAAVIQKKDLDEKTTLSAFWFSNILGTVLGLILACVSPLVAATLKTPAVTPVLLVLALSFPLSSLGTVPLALLERESRFALVARIEVTSSALAFAIAVVFALAGAGPFSLVAQSVAGIVFSTSQLWVAVQWRPRWHFARSELGALWRFGGYLAAFNLVNYLSRNADSLVIGRFLGAAPLGVYAQAYRLMLFPVQNLSWVSGRALFPVMSRAQDSVEELGRMYLRVVALITAVSAPLMAGLFVLRAPFVHVVLGDRWGDVAPLLALLAPTGLIQSIVSTTGSVFMACGRTQTLFYLGVLGAALNLSAFVIGVHWGLGGVATCYLVANVLNAVPVLHLTLGLVGHDLWALVRSIFISIALSGVMAVAVDVAMEASADGPLPGPLRLAALTALGAALYALLSRLANRTVYSDVLRLGGIGRPARAAR